MQFIIKTLEGLEEVLAQELSELQLSDIKILRRAVSCTGSWAQLYKCNYELRTALRVLVPIKRFELQTQEDLYNAVQSIKWKDYIPKNKSFAINGTVSGELFKHSQFAIYRTKDAIVDQLTDEYDKRPKVSPKDPDILVDIHLNNTTLSLSLDSTGRSLHIRNYKYRNYKAPLNEVLAAGIIALSGWDGTQTFHDPMCGSGTFVTEALMIAANIPASKFNANFAFQNWTEFHPEIWNLVKESGDARIKHPKSKLFASDINPMAVRDTKKNLQKFPFKEHVKVFERDFFTLPPKSGTCLFMNPPYNKRIEMQDIHAFYKKIGDTLKTKWAGSQAWLISSNNEAMKHFGLRSSKRIHLNHGGTEAKLYNFEIYEGSKKHRD